MLFNSTDFLFIFLPIVLIGFYALGRAGQLKLVMLWLMAASLFFYSWWNPVYLPIIIGSVLFNFGLGRVLNARRTTQDSQSRWLLGLGIAANLLLLGYYKYAGFFVENLNRFGGGDMQVPDIVLPLAISFFTFQQIAFLVDSFRGKAVHTSLLNYGVFVTFFPQLIAGPIVHHREMMPQLTRSKIFEWRPERFAVGWTIFIIGLFKKVVLADYFDQLATPVFAAAEAGEVLHFYEAWAGALAYTFQIYFDFSGYSDMAIGIARLFGVRLPLNFYSPYKAETVVDFWRRWHLTLSRFLRDYLYIPLGGNRKGKLRRTMNLLITMLLGGLWHGAGWNFVIWGALHGVYLVINHSWRGAVTFNRSHPVWRSFSRVLTFLAIVLAWVFFRAESFSGATHILSAMGSFEGLGAFYAELYDPLGPVASIAGKRAALLSIPLSLLALVFVWVMPNASEIMRLWRPHIGSEGLRRVLRGRFSPLWQPTAVWGTLMGILMVVALVKVVYEPSQVFLYFQF